MANNKYVEIDIPEAADLADYSGIEFDLRTAREFAQRLLDEYGKEQPDWGLTDPFMTAILVRYFRAFVPSGARLSLGQAALATLSAEQRAKHEWFRAVRNKYIAHSENAFEENQPVARFWDDRVREEGIEQIQCNRERVAGLGPEHLRALIELATVLLKYVDERLEEEKAKVLTVIRRMPIADVLAMRVKPKASGLPDPTKRRT